MDIIKDGHSIQTVDDWFQFAPPKGGLDHWRDGRSAKEFARAWFTSGRICIPDELSKFLSSHPDLGQVTLETGEPEARIPFDKRRGEVRNADMAILAYSNAVPLAVTIEAKADEVFGDTVSETLAAALDRLLENDRSGGIDRTRDLAKSLLPPASGKIPRSKNLRYQLLTAVAGTLAFASRIKAPHAVLIIYEFHTDETSSGKLQQNAQDLDAFLCRLSAGQTKTAPIEKLLGPFQVPGEPLFPEPAKLYIGKIVRVVSPNGLWS